MYNKSYKANIYIIKFYGSDHNTDNMFIMGW